MVDSQLMHNALCIGQLSFAQMQAHLCLDSWKLACQHAYWLQFKDKSFHIAFDKGALDALMGEDTDAARVAGGKLLSEVQRVLDSCDGQYLCVTLGQTHVLSERAICHQLSAIEPPRLHCCCLGGCLSCCLNCTVLNHAEMQHIC